MSGRSEQAKTIKYNRLTPKLALQLAAPHTWAASVFPSVFGVMYCVYRSFDIGFAQGLLLVSACVLMQSAVNTFNDYMDFVKGTDSREDNLEKEDAVLLYAGVDPAQVRLLAFLFLGIAAAIGIGFAFRVGPVPLLIGLSGGIIVLLYSGGPLPISYLPIGELTSGFVMGGLIPLGVVSAVTGRMHPEILPMCLPFITGIGLIMMTNNTCDIEKDERAGRRTFPGCLGRHNAVLVYRALVVLWMILIVLFGAALGPMELGMGLILTAVAYRPVFHFLMRSPLTQKSRVAQMKGIMNANICGGSICLVLMAAAIWAKN